MNIKIKNILKNILYSFTTNIISVIISTASVILLPKIMSIDSYGAWQLYLFYTTYLGFFHFGWLDGIYLRYGGSYFDKLNKSKFTGQFILLLLVELMIAIIAIIFINLFIIDYLTRQILIFVSFILLPVILSNFVVFILQIVNKIKEYAYVSLLERILFLIILIIFVCFTNNDYIELIYLDIICKILSVLYGIYLIRALFVLKLENIYVIINETKENLLIGYKLLVANIAGMLILGIIRFAISQEWDVATFGKVSLTLSCSNFLMTFINALSIVFYPILKRSNKNKFSNIYLKIRILLTSILLILLTVYYPLKFILEWWLPKYQDSLIYIAILLPVCLFESKVVLLINTYLKSLRKEKLMLKINFYTLILSLILTYIGTVLLHNLSITILCILIVFAFKSIYSEILLNDILKLHLSKLILQEILIVILFVSINSLSDNIYINLLVYILVLILYIFINKNYILQALKLFK